MRVAAVQLTSTADKEANFAIAARLVEKAADDGATLVVLPEMFNCLGSGSVLRDGAESLDGPTSQWAAGIAKEWGIHLVAGSFIERSGAAVESVESAESVESGGDDRDDEHLRADRRNHNTSCLYGPDGSRLAVYRKIHLFDVDVPGAEFRESEGIAAGSEIVVVDAGPVRVGLNICYDLRFPELFRIEALRGATLATLPSAFTATTGPPHWEVLIRARAIENQMFVIAAGQRGASTDSLVWHGHSMIVDPWGNILAQAPDAECVITADLDLVDQASIRSRLPSLANRRPDSYVWPDDAP